MSWNQGLFSRRLKLLRISKGLSQARLAGLAGVSQSTLNKWELGLSIPSLDRAFEVAESLGCSLALLCGEGSLDEAFASMASGVGGHHADD
ncbi:helix-turn-helix domain-containing protein [Olsenella profusa]|uniref:helix-turn-helix transcriptional regulator n=1 Tax=Olsenella profusa TaxID=138595 RepID=UPI0009FE0900